MARVRLSGPAQADVAHILTTSYARWGPDAGRRYAALLAAAMRQIASEPEGPMTRAHTELFPDVRSLHLRHASVDDPEAKVGSPVHVVYYRTIRPELIEIVRVLHERMQPTRHIGE